MAANLPTTTDIQEIASEAADWFTTGTRYEGEPGKDTETFRTLKSDAPEWVKDIVREAHGDFLPDDWRYDKIEDALRWISKAAYLEDYAEFAEDAVDTYNAARFAWLSSNLNRAGYCDQALEEFGYASGDRPFGIVDIIGWGQYTEATEIYGLTLKALQDVSAEVAADN